MSNATYFLFHKTMTKTCWNQRRKNHPELMFSDLSFIFLSFPFLPFRKHVFMQDEKFNHYIIILFHKSILICRKMSWASY